MLLALVTTGLRRSELCALDWRDLGLGGRKPSLLVRCGKGGKPRRQPLPASLARELRRLRGWPDTRSIGEATLQGRFVDVGDARTLAALRSELAGWQRSYPRRKMREG